LNGSNSIQRYQRRGDLGARLLDVGHDQVIVPWDRARKAAGDTGIFPMRPLRRSIELTRRSSVSLFHPQSSFV
jgi:hypothetical protein